MKTLLIAAVLTALAGAACAQPAALGPGPAEGAGPAGRQPRDLDLDHDGRVTLAEMKKADSGSFISRLDANGDGKVTRAEFKALEDRAREHGGEAGVRRADGVFAMLDANKDGVISKAEREAAIERRFKMVDTNHDGWLSKGEVLMLRRQNGPRAN